MMQLQESWLRPYQVCSGCQLMLAIWVPPSTGSIVELVSTQMPWNGGHWTSAAPGHRLFAALPNCVMSCCEPCAGAPWQEPPSHDVLRHWWVHLLRDQALRGLRRKPGGISKHRGWHSRQAEELKWRKPWECEACTQMRGKQLQAKLPAGARCTAAVRVNRYCIHSYTALLIEQMLSHNITQVWEHIP